LRPRGLEGGEALPELLAGSGLVSRDCGPRRRHDAHREIIGHDACRRSHASGEELGEQPGQTERLEIVIERRVDGDRDALGGDNPPGGGDDGLVAVNLPHEVGAGESGDVEHRGKPFIARRGHDAEQAGRITRRHLDAHPAGGRPHRGDQGRMPGGRPRREQLVGLGLVEPDREIVERMAGEEDCEALGVHVREIPMPEDRPKPVIHMPYAWPISRSIAARRAWRSSMACQWANSISTVSLPGRITASSLASRRIPWM